MNDSDLQQEIEQLKQSRFYKELATLPFNPFEVMDVSKNEILHSKILKWLLNDYEFSKKLLTWIATKLGKPEWKDINFSEPEVSREYTDTEYGRIDVLAHFQSESVNLVVGIEVKINADEREEQISDYQKLLLKNYPDIQKQKVVVFLTPEGRPPETADETHVVQVLAMEWGDIAKIIDEMPARLTDKGIFRMQFLQHLKIEFLREEERIAHKLLSQPGNLEIIRNITNKMSQEEIEKEEMVHKIIENRSSLQTSLECEFWRELENRLKYKNLEFQSYYDGLDGPRMEVIENEKLEECIRWRAGSLGLIFSIPDRFSIPNSSLYDNHEVVCRITRDDDSHIYYGFVLCEKKGNLRKRVVINGENHKKYLDLYGKLGLDHGPDEDGKHGWLGWKEQAKVKIYFANNRKPQLFDTLVKMKDKENVVNELVDEIYKFIDEKYAKLLTIYPEQEKGE